MPHRLTESGLARRLAVWKRIMEVMVMVHLWSAKVVIIQVYDCTGDQCPHWDAKCSGHLSVIQRQRRGLQFSRVWSQVKQ